MPIKDYFCLECKIITEELHKVCPEEIVCPKCGGKAIKFPSKSNFVLGKGSWEKNDYNG